MGLARVLVSCTVFKTAREARAVSGGFDSHTVPPIIFNKIFFNKAFFVRTPLLIKTNPLMRLCSEVRGRGWSDLMELAR